VPRSSRQPRPAFDVENGIDGHELERLLGGGVSPARLVHEYWGIKMLHVSGFADRYRGLFDRDAFFRAIERGAQLPPSSGFELVAAFDAQSDRDEFTPMTRIQPSQARTMLAAGATLQARNVTLVDANLAAFASAVKAQIGCPGTLMLSAFLSPEGTGFKTHLDAKNVIGWQIEGRKRWRVSKRKAVETPTKGALYLSDGYGQYEDGTEPAEPWEQFRRIPPKDFVDVVLAPGDAFFVPAGVWHGCDAQGESLSMSFAVAHCPVADVLASALDALLGNNASWRSAPVLGAGDRASDAFWGARLGEVRRAIDELERRPLHIRRALATRATALPIRDADVAPENGDARRGIGKDDLLRLSRRRASVSVGDGNGDESGGLLLCVGERSLELDDPGLAAITKEILRRKRFRAGDCVTWARSQGRVDWSSARDLLGALVEVGALETEYSTERARRRSTG
jgi:JmjC domain